MIDKFSTGGALVWTSVCISSVSIRYEISLGTRTTRLVGYFNANTSLCIVILFMDTNRNYYFLAMLFFRYKWVGRYNER